MQYLLLVLVRLGYKPNYSLRLESLIEASPFLEGDLVELSLEMAATLNESFWY